MDKLFKIFDILDATAEDCRNALRSNISDYEDAILVESAKRNDIDCIVTCNVKDFKDSNISVYSPTELLRVLKNKEQTQN